MVELEFIDGNSMADQAGDDGRTPGGTPLAPRLSERSGRTGTRQREKEGDPQTNEQGEARQERRKAMHDLVVGAVDDAMQKAQGDVRPCPADQPSRVVSCGQGKGTERIEQDRNFEQVSEVVRGLHIFEACRQLHGCCGGLGVDALAAHLSHPAVEEPSANGCGEDHERQAGGDDVRCVRRHVKWWSCAVQTFELA